MNKQLLWRACVVGLVLVAISAPAAFAAPPQQTGEPTSPPLPTLTPTETPFPPRFPTSTPTPGITPGENSATPFLPPGSPSPTGTLPPPPSGGGRVAVAVLYVREGPSFGSQVVGSLLYGDVVSPLGRDVEGKWVAIQWEDQIAWVFASLVVWDPALDFATLPILSAEGSLTPPITGSPTAMTQTPTETPSPTFTLTASATPAPTSTPSPIPTATPEPSATALPVSTPPPNSPANDPFRGIRGPISSGVLIGGGALLAVLAFYGWRRLAGRRELLRYADGFLFDRCPVCREGQVHLEQVVRRSMGVPSVLRSVRCDSCHSVLREIKPGLWRYTVDGFVNPEMASRYNAQRLTEADLVELAYQADMTRDSGEVDEARSDADDQSSEDQTESPDG